METIFRIVAAPLVAASAFFYFTGHNDAMFLSLVLGCLSFIMSFRVRAGKLTSEQAEKVRLDEIGRPDADLRRDSPETEVPEVSDDRHRKQ